MEKNIKNGEKKKKQTLRPIDKGVKKTFDWWGKSIVFIRTAKIKTWQGVFVLALIAGASLSTLFISLMNYYDSIHAAANQATLSLVPANGTNGALTVQKDQTFDVDIVLDAYQNNVVAVKADVQFDQTKFRLDSCSTEDSPFGVNGNCTTSSANPFQIVNDNRSSGEIIITQASTSAGAGVQNESGKIATLTFTALQATVPSAANITLKYNVGSDQYDDSDVIIYGNTGTDILTDTNDATITVVAPDTTPPTIISIVRRNPTSQNTSATSAVLRITFSEDVENVGIDDFVMSGTAASAIEQLGTGQTITQISSSIYDYTISKTFDGTFYLSVNENQDIQDSAGNAYILSGTDGIAGVNEQYNFDLSQPVAKCIGALPADAVLCDGDDTDLAEDTSFVEVTTCGIPKCEYTKPIISDYSCSGDIPANAVLCSGDGASLTADTANSLVASCGMEKCEYACAAGYIKNGSICEDDGNGNIAADGEIDIDDDVDISDISKPKIKIGSSGGKTLSTSKTVYSKNDKFYFKGKDSDLAGGKVKIYEGGNSKGETSVGADGSWKLTAKPKKDGAYEYRLKYYTANGTEIGKSGKYVVKVDTEDPEFTDLPNFLNKRRGDVLWWKATDNKKVDHYKYYFNGKTREIKKDSFVIPLDTPTGLQYLKVRVYDKAGNTEVRNIIVRVR